MPCKSALLAAEKQSERLKQMKRLQWKKMKVHRRAVRTHCHECSSASLCYYWWHVSMRVKPGEKLELSFLKGTFFLRHYLNMYVITCKEINVLPRDRDHLPHCQTPSLKRIYTKAHSLNLHLLDLHPECWGMATGRGGKRQKEDSSDRPAQTIHTQVMRP